MEAYESVSCIVAMRMPTFQRPDLTRSGEGLQTNLLSRRRRPAVSIARGDLSR
jgi:hypothetical protein